MACLAMIIVLIIIAAGVFVVAGGLGLGAVGLTALVFSIVRSRRSRASGAARYVFEPSGRVIRQGVGRLPSAPLSFQATGSEICKGVQTQCSWDAGSSPVGGWSNSAVAPHMREQIEVYYTCASRKDFRIDVTVLKPEHIANAFDGGVTVYGTVGP